MNVLQLVKTAQQHRQALYLAQKLHAASYRGTEYTPHFKLIAAGAIPVAEHVPGSCRYRGVNY